MIRVKKNNNSMPLVILVQFKMQRSPQGSASVFNHIYKKLLSTREMCVSDIHNFPDVVYNFRSDYVLHAILRKDTL